MSELSLSELESDVEPELVVEEEKKPKKVKVARFISYIYNLSDDDDAWLDAMEDGKDLFEEILDNYADKLAKFDDSRSME